MLTSPASLMPNYDLSSIQDRLGPYHGLSTSRISSGEPPSINTSAEDRRTGELVCFEDVDTGQRMEFEALLKKVFFNVL